MITRYMTLSTSNMFITQWALYNSIGFISRHIPVSFNYVSSNITKSLIFKIALVTDIGFSVQYSQQRRHDDDIVESNKFAIQSNIGIGQHFQTNSQYSRIQVYGNTFKQIRNIVELGIWQHFQTNSQYSRIQVYGNTFNRNSQYSCLTVQ